MIESIKVKIQPLSAEAFRPYGQTLDPILDNKQLIFPEVEPGQGRVAIEMRSWQPGSVSKRMNRMVIHFSYNQTFIPLQGSMVLVVAPPPRNRQAPEAEFEFDYERVAAFMVVPGQAALVEKGVWHATYWIGAQCTLVNVTRKNPGEGVGTTAKRPYVECVDIEKRDNRVIELEFGSANDLVKA